MKHRRIIALAILGSLTLAACATQPYVDTDDTPGFFSGLLHGFIAWGALIWHLFDHSVRIYAYPNSGGWYDLGFLIGAGVWGGGSGAAARG